MVPPIYSWVLARWVGSLVTSPAWPMSRGTGVSFHGATGVLPRPNHGFLQIQRSSKTWSLAIHMTSTTSQMRSVPSLASEEEPSHTHHPNDTDLLALDDRALDRLKFGNSSESLGLVRSSQEKCTPGMDLGACFQRVCVNFLTTTHGFFLTCRRGSEWHWIKWMR